MFSQLSFVLPKMFREQKIANKILRLEQEGEHPHQVFNSLENKYKNVSRREDRFWYILTEFENKLYVKDSLFKVKKRNFNRTWNKCIFWSCIKCWKFFGCGSLIFVRTLLYRFNIYFWSVRNAIIDGYLLTEFVVAYHWNVTLPSLCTYKTLYYWP